MGMGMGMGMGIMTPTNCVRNRFSGEIFPLTSHSRPDRISSCKSYLGVLFGTIRWPSLKRQLPLTSAVVAHQWSRRRSSVSKLYCHTPPPFDNIPIPLPWGPFPPTGSGKEYPQELIPYKLKCNCMSFQAIVLSLKPKHFKIRRSINLKGFRTFS